MRVRKVYKHGKLNGSYKTWHANKKPASAVFYRDDVLHGRYETFDEKGTLRIKTKYEAGKLDGKYEAFVGRRRVTEQLTRLRIS